MSVPEPKRTENKLEVCIKALDLCTYTLQITKNKNVFVAEYQDALTDKIIQTAIDIHTCVWSANNVLVNSPKSYENRRNLQETAAIKCNVLLSLIDIAKPLFHLSYKRVTYWSGKAIKTRNLIRNWKKSDAERYKQYKRDVG